LSARAAGVTIAPTAVASSSAVTTASVAARAAEATAGGSTVAGTLRSSVEAAAAATVVTAETTTAKLSEIAVGTTSSATTAARAATSAATTEGRLTGDGLEERRNLLVSLLQEIHKLSNDSTVATVEESSSDTSVSSTTGTTDTVDVVVNISRKIVVDDVGDVRDIETSGGNSGSDQNGASSVTEELESTLTFALGAVTVDGSSGEVLVDEEVGKRIGHTLSLNEDQSETVGVGVENVQKNGALVDILNVLNLLSNVLRSRTDTTDREEDVVLEEITGKHLNVAGESG
jgi:hypothetical protein